MNRCLAAKQIEINGVVQGVGFRPFIFQLAQAHKLFGNVSNTAEGVRIQVEGDPAQIAAFLSEIPRLRPPLAHIVHINAQDISINNYQDFKIISSSIGNERSALISPDVSICNDCKDEIFDPKNRRFRYPFTNCTNCGPRYTIIHDIPYDRPKTAMAAFKMCSLCKAEYNDPTNRRFHAQPNACPTCGPQLTLCSNDKQSIITEDPIKTTADLLKEGHIVAIKGLGGFHLAVDATLPSAVSRLRSRKRREEKPLAMMSLGLEEIGTYAHLTSENKQLLTGIQRPIVLLIKKKTNAIASQVAPGNHYFGVMLPYTPLHYLLLSEGFTALVMTSANLSEEPIAIDNDEAFERLNQIADFFLIHNRDIYLRSDDSIVRHILDAPRFIRRSRGYVPIPIYLSNPLPPILACGAELKNTICLTKDKNAFISQHIGDLENLATENFLRLTVNHLKQILDIHPEAIACDQHPDYLSTRYAKEQTDVPLIQVQHHHAHIAACMAENRIEGPVIGLAFDGTGFGPDHTIWGGEVLITEYTNFKRVAHLAQVPMPGSTMAIKEPWRMAISHLLTYFKNSPLPSDLPLFKIIENKKVATVISMVRKDINCPVTSSLGRLFDAIAALLGLRYEVAFEGQAAMELEMIADKMITDRYELPVTQVDPIQINTAPLIAQIVEDIYKGLSPAVISAKFHQSLSSGFTQVCERLRKENKINKVVLSGGVFQNAILLEKLSKNLIRQNFDVYMHRLVPTNDGGISLGQAVVAGHRLIRGDIGEQQYGA
jgi:hydrogenase maturation protein HypF